LARDNAPVDGGVRQPVVHDSAHKHVSGEALYVDDIPVPEDCLQVHLATSPHAHAEIVEMDLTEVAVQPGVVCVVCAADIPGINDVSPLAGDDPLLAEGLVEYAGQPLFAVAAESLDQAREAARLARVSYRELPAILTIDEALAANSEVLPAQVLQQGDPDAALASAPHQLSGRFRLGGQEHFYLEGQAALAIPGEDQDLRIHSSTQHPTEIQHLVARLLNLADNAVSVEVRRMGGAFGGKESQAAPFAALAALIAHRTGRPAKVIPDRDDDIRITGKRHDFRIDYQVGFAESGQILGLELILAARCGRSADLSGPVNDRAMFHADNAYYLENARIRSVRCRTHTASNTAFRGFGGPQGMIAIEHVIDHIARSLDLDPLEVRKLNLYQHEERNQTPYGMTVEDNILPELIAELEQQSDYASRREAVRDFNAQNAWIKKGLALTPVKFGIAFTNTFLNQAGALVHVYTDGSVHLNHGGTEMGQGLYTKVAQVVAEEFQLPLEKIKVTATSTEKVPNTTATAASSGADLNGKAAQAAARTIKQRLIAFAAEHYEVIPDQVRFQPGTVRVGSQFMSFADLVRQAWMARISLSATGFYRTPKIAYDPKTGRGRPFFYFSYGAAVSEVTIDTLTGESRVERVDILHDVGESLNPAIDLGQVEGGFIQGMGWLTTEELVWDQQGHLSTHAPSTYKIPTSGDRPAVMNIKLLENSPNRERTVFRSKAVGEPPLMLAISVHRALWDAVAACGSGVPDLDAPATPERLLAAIEGIRQT
jgi:xanthine dehydrogenase large subunit